MNKPTRIELEAVAQHAEADYPFECCGLITRSTDGLTRCRTGQNIETVTGLFDLSPSTIIDTHRRNETITGLYHSHCDGPAALSLADLKSLVLKGEPIWPGVDVFIASVEGGHCVYVQRFVWSDVTKTYEADERYHR